MEQNKYGTKTTKSRKVRKEALETITKDLLFSLVLYRRRLFRVYTAFFMPFTAKLRVSAVLLTMIFHLQLGMNM